MNEAQSEYLQRIAGEHEAVPEAGCRKPDPSEPWRYVCPDCGGQVRSTSHMAGEVYRCATRDCRNRLERSELHDQKQDSSGDIDA